MSFAIGQPVWLVCIGEKNGKSVVGMLETECGAHEWARSKGLVRYRVIASRIEPPEASREFWRDARPLEFLGALADRFNRHEIVGPDPCVYLLIKCGRIVYVGQTMNLAGRIQGHGKAIDFDEVRFLRVPAEAMNAVEFELIARLRPPMNKSVGKGRDPELAASVLGGTAP